MGFILVLEIDVSDADQGKLRYSNMFLWCIGRDELLESTLCLGCVRLSLGQALANRDGVGSG